MYFCEAICHSGFCHNPYSFVEKEIQTGMGGIPLLPPACPVTSTSAGKWFPSYPKAHSTESGCEGREINVIHFTHSLPCGMCLAPFPTWLSPKWFPICFPGRSLVWSWCIPHLVPVITLSQPICGRESFYISCPGISKAIKQHDIHLSCIVQSFVVRFKETR